MNDGQVLLFPPFRLDVKNAQLWRDDEEVNLRPKSFEVLCYLLEHPGQLVTKAALLDAIWADVTVGDNLPAGSIKELRKALGDEARAPRFIETVQRRGYRFIAPVGAERTTALRPAQLRTRSDSAIIGREAELAQLDKWFAQVLEKRRVTLFVTGEAGIGKTSCVSAFLDSIAQRQTLRIGRGQCIEQYGSGAPYLPVLEALSRLAREPGGERVRDVLSQFAPSWLAQMPELQTREERSRLQNDAQGVTQQRMLREMTQALDVLGADEALILVLEDLHWSDFSTLELIAAIARRNDPARIMIIGTYRPFEIAGGNHPLPALKEELQLHRNCEELPLQLLGPQEIEQFLRQRLPDAGSISRESLISLIHARTGGNPLFMINAIEYLAADSALRVKAAKIGEADWAERLPLSGLRNLTQMIESNLERLKPEEQKVLEAASVAGTEFSGALVAAALALPQAEIEGCCLRLSRRTQFLVEAGPLEWPDDTIATGFRFRHAAYQQVLYKRLAAGQRTNFHRLIAARLAAAYRGCSGEVASELATHYQRANLKLEAIQYFQLAGQRALSRAAVTEGRDDFAEAIKLLHELPEGAARDRQELDLQLAIAPALVAVMGGWYAPETERAWARAQELSTRLDDSPGPFSATFGMYALRLVRGKINQANELAEQLLKKAQDAKDASQILYAHAAAGITFYFKGEFASALQNLAICSSAYDIERDGSLILNYGFDAGVWSLCYTAAAHWQLGYPDRALSKIEEAFSLARSQSHPLSLAQAQLWASIVHQMRGEAYIVGDLSDRLSALSSENGLDDWLYWTGCLHGWALARQGDYARGIAEILESQTKLEERGLRVWRPYFRCLLADACLVAGRVEDGLRSLEEALIAADDDEERAHASQIYRLKGELLSVKPAPDFQRAGACFEQALEVARGQGAKSFELQAAISYARLLEREGERSKARVLLESASGWFNEGFDTADFKDAECLLDDLLA